MLRRAINQSLSHPTFPMHKSQKLDKRVPWDTLDGNVTKLNMDDYKGLLIPGMLWRKVLNELVLAAAFWQEQFRQYLRIWDFAGFTSCYCNCIRLQYELLTDACTIEQVSEGDTESLCTWCTERNAQSARNFPYPCACGGCPEGVCRPLAEAHS